LAGGGKTILMFEHRVEDVLSIRPDGVVYEGGQIESTVRRWS